MRLLLDESLTRHLARELIGHEVRTVAHEGWAGLSNGELLKRGAEAGFEVLLTAFHGFGGSHRFDSCRAHYELRAPDRIAS